MTIASSAAATASPKPSHFRTALVSGLAWFVLFVGMVATATTWKLIADDVTGEASTRFDWYVSDAVAGINSRMTFYEEALRAGVAFFNAVEPVSRTQWRDFIETRGIGDRFPGIQGLGWSVVVQPEELDRHIASVRAEGLPDYKLRPDGTRDLYTSIVYLEPFDQRNQRAFGFDMFSEPTRRAAMTLARDWGEPRLSGKVTLVQETESEPQAGCLLYAPVYRKGADVSLAAGRQAAILGFVYAPFRMNDLMENILGPSHAMVALRIFDGPSASAADLMFDSHRRVQANLANPVFRIIRTTVIAGRLWTLEFRSTPTFDATIDWARPTWAAAAGAVLTLLLFALIKAFSLSYGRAVLMAGRMTRELRASEEKARTIVDNVADGIVTINASGNIESFTPSAERIFGWKSGEVIGRNVSCLMPEPDRSRHDLYVHNYLSTGQAKIIGTRREVVGQRKDGSTFAMELAIGQFEIGGERMFTGVVRDITDRKQAETAKNEFVSTVSHELRTPLTSIKGSLGLIRGGVAGDLPQKLKQMLDIAYNNCDRLVRLINDILDVEKIAAGKMEFRMVPIDLLALLPQAIEANRGYGKQQNDVTFSLKTDLTGAPVTGDLDRLMQVLANLLSNAAKFSPRGGEVEIGLVRHGAGFRISVADRGPGIPEEFRDKIFQRFSQADSSDKRQVSGTGLGLNITKAIVERHGGTVSFDSEVGRGTTFYVDLVERRVEVVNAIAAVRDRIPVGRRVLVCEDEPDIARLIKLMLEQDGYVADIVGTAAEAKRDLASRRYDAMTLDILLPDQDGLSLVKELQQSAAALNIPIVIVSALKSRKMTPANTDAVRVVDWLEKPIDQVRLLASIRSAISLSSSTMPRILHVEDDEDVTQIVRSIVGNIGTMVHAGTLAEARRCLEDGAFDLMILDLMLPDGNGEELLSLVDALDQAMPVIIFSVNELGGPLGGKCNAVLTKSRTTNEELRDAIRASLDTKSFKPKLPAS